MRKGWVGAQDVVGTQQNKGDHGANYCSDEFGCFVFLLAFVYALKGVLLQTSWKD